MGYLIKDYFANYLLHMSDVTLDMRKNEIIVHQLKVEPWKVTLVDTGEKTLTGGRLKRVREYLKDDEAFCFTYGDGLSNVDISASIKYHLGHGRMATVTAVRPPGRYGALERNSKGLVTAFTEKPLGDGGLINGGFFVLSPSCLDLIEGDQTSWEGLPLEELARREEVMAYEHHGFWQPMDTLRDKISLESLWESGFAPWKIWK